MDQKSSSYGAIRVMESEYSLIRLQGLYFSRVENISLDSRNVLNY